MQRREPSTLGRRLRALRVEKRMSLRVVADLAGISESHLSRLESGQRILDKMSLVDRLASALGLTRQALLGEYRPVAEPRRAVLWTAGSLGAVALQAVRRRLAFDQDQLAHVAGMPTATIAAWETGRSPLFAAAHADVHDLRTAIRIAGCTAADIALLDTALHADTILAGVDRPADRHSLARVVPNRAVSDLLSWVIAGQRPVRLQGDVPDLLVASADRESIAAALRDVADHGAANELGTAMLRRQARYLLAAHEPSRSWAKDVACGTTSTTADIRSWSPSWAAARTAAVAAADDDPDGLDRFIRDGLSAEQGIRANLTYWAYWTGELRETWVSDAEMTADPSGWSGRTLLESLLAGLDNSLPYRNLCAHTLWALVQERTDLLRSGATRRSLTEVVDRALARNDLSPSARDRLTLVIYGIADRT